MEVAQNAVAINALREPCFPELGLEGHRPIRGLLHRGTAVRLQINAIEIELASRDGEAGPCQRELRIKPNRLGIKVSDLFCRVEGGGVVDCDRAQVSVIRCRILGRLLRDGFLLGAGELGVELVGNGVGHLAFHSKDIVEFAIVAFRPKMFVRCGADQLDVHVHSISDFLHTALEKMRHA